MGFELRSPRCRGGNPFIWWQLANRHRCHPFGDRRSRESRLLARNCGAACLARYQATLDECGARVVLKDHLAALAKRIHSRGEGAAGIDGTLNDLSVRVLAVPSERAAAALNDYLGESGNTAILGAQDQDVEVSTVLSELLPNELGAVIAQSQVKDSAPIVLIELPGGTPTDRTTVQQLVPWLRDPENRSRRAAI
jgi:hypothetical protein